MKTWMKTAKTKKFPHRAKDVRIMKMK